LRLKYRGISTTQLLEQKRKNDWRESQLIHSDLLFAEESKDLAAELEFIKKDNVEEPILAWTEDLVPEAV
jgi:hypothetical protein